MKINLISPIYKELFVPVYIDCIRIVFKDNNTAQNFFTLKKEFKINSNLYKLSINDNIIDIDTLNKNSNDFIKLYDAVKSSLLEFGVDNLIVNLDSSEDLIGKIISFYTKNMK